MTIEIGTEAPDFELRDQHKQPVRLSDYRGKKAVVVVFLPFAFSRICTGELCSFRDEIEEFQNDDVQVLAITCDTPFTNAAWAEQQGYTFPLLSDFWPHGATAQAYDSFDEHVGCPLRGSFVIDRDGIVRWTVVNGIPDARDLDAYRSVLADLG
jgi:mycoredoxin-dependent peroxiredoxin